MKKVLVYGGLGFLGHYLVNELLSRGYEVTIADIHENQKLNNVKYIVCDITVKENVKNVFKNTHYVI